MKDVSILGGVGRFDETASGALTNIDIMKVKR